jgi:hypothetical protein
VNPRYERVAARIDELVEELDEISFDELREAAARGHGRPDSDRRATQARRALEKASRLLTDSSADDCG